MKNAFILFLALVTLSACEPKLNANQKKWVSQIDTLHYAADTMLVAMNAVNDSLLQSQVDEIERVYKTVGLANPDSADKRFWITEINRLEFMYSSYSKFLRDAGGIKSGLENSQKQLEALKNSIVDSKVDSAQAEEYLNQEARVLGELQVKFYKRQPNAKRAIVMWDTTQTHFIDLAAQVTAAKQ